MTEDVHVLLKLGAAEGLHLLDWILQGTGRTLCLKEKKELQASTFHAFIFLRHISITTFEGTLSISVYKTISTPY